VGDHRTVEAWMGSEVQTLADLLSPGLRAVCVGINPSPVSVAAGHYYQGRIGQRFFSRLTQAGILPRGDGFEDDRAFAAGIGFTDIVKRPTARAHDVTVAEFTHGRHLLVTKLEATAPNLVIFTFKKSAQVLFGDFFGNGFVDVPSLAGAEVFVMPGPYEAAVTVAETMRHLAGRLDVIG
jgi:TDG/mug DNA glycosylase family protein